MDPVNVELSAAAADFAEIERALADLDKLPDVALHEAEPDNPVLRSTGWQAVVISIASAGGLKAVRDIVIARITNRRVKISISRVDTKVTFDGPIHKADEVERIVRELTADQPSE
jgi:hypothetical protein